MNTIQKHEPPARLDPLNDVLFIKVFGEKGDEGQLLGFLNAALDRTGDDRLVSVEILEDKTFTAKFLGDKTSILDLRAQLQDGTKVIIEVQLTNLKNMDRRSLFYWSKEYTSGIKKGQDYIDLPKIIAINIIDYNFLATEKVHTVFHIRDDSEHELMLTDVLEIHFINMVKWRKLKEKDIKGDPLHQWLSYLDRTSPPDLVEEVKKMNEGIQMADERMVYVTGDEEAIRAYEMRQMAIYDMNTRFRESFEEGISQGKAEGLAEANLEIARKMKSLGDSAERIHTITGLSTETIETL
ncbi:MAG: Rpn family recombination-promoting nuclease/putative transposase [Treponema sp.]|nr:Rpn family recombination-promoting nuclease/putative transposase [Treponema sp.]